MPVSLPARPVHFNEEVTRVAVADEERATLGRLAVFAVRYDDTLTEAAPSRSGLAGLAVGGIAAGGAVAVSCTPSPWVAVTCPTVVAAAAVVGAAVGGGAGHLAAKDKAERTSFAAAVVDFVPFEPHLVLQEAVSGAARRRAAHSIVAAADLLDSKPADYRVLGLDARGIDTVLELSILRILAYDMRDGRYAFVVPAGMRLVRPRTGAVLADATLVYRSEARAAEAWRADGNAAARAMLVTAGRVLAERIVAASLGGAPE